MYESNVQSNQNSMAPGTFPTQWNRGNIVTIHKKKDKQIVSNY